MEKIAPLKSRKAFLTHRLEQELRELCPPKKVRPFDPDILPTNEAIIWHRDHLIATGELTENTPNLDKIVCIASDLLAVWEQLETPNRPFLGVRDKVKAVLKKWRDLKGRGGWSKLCNITCNCLAKLKEQDIPEDVDEATGMPRVPCTCGNKDKWTSEIVRFYKDQRLHTAAPTLKMWRPWSREVTEQQIQEELDNAFNQVDADRKAPPMESQHAAVQEQRSKSWLITVTRMRVMVALSSMTSAVPGHRESPSLTEKWATASQ